MDIKDKKTPNQDVFYDALGLSLQPLSQSLCGEERLELFSSHPLLTRHIKEVVHEKIALSLSDHFSQLADKINLHFHFKRKLH